MVWGLGFRVSEFGFGVILGLPDRSPCCVLCLWYPLVVQAVSSSLTSSAAWTLGFFCGLSWWLACSDQVAASTTNPDDLAGISSGHGRRRVAATALRSVLIPKPKLRPRPWLVLCFCKHSTYLQRCVEVASLTMTALAWTLVFVHSWPWPFPSVSLPLFRPKLMLPILARPCIPGLGSVWFVSLDGMCMSVCYGQGDIETECHPGASEQACLGPWMHVALAFRGSTP